jgi:hypothetical protein
MSVSVNATPRCFDLSGVLVVGGGAVGSSGGLVLANSLDIINQSFMVCTHLLYKFEHLPSNEFTRWKRS